MVNIGIIGTGNMGQIHARVLHDMRALAAVADTDFEKAKKVATQYNVKAFDSFETMLEDVLLDGVVVATPTRTHARIAEKIAQDYTVRGILIEKPLASTLSDAIRIAKIIRKKQLAVVVSHSEIYNPVVSRAFRIIRDGDIGVVRTVIHDRRGFVEPSRIKSLGDVFEDIGVHDFDIMRRISTGSAKLYAQSDLENEVYNAGTVLVKFEKGAEHVFHLSRQYVGRKRSMDVSGTQGTLTIDLFGQIITVRDIIKEPSSDSRTIRLPEQGATIKVYGEPVQEVNNDFIRCINGNKVPQVGLDDGIATLEIVEAARKSVRTGKVVDIEIQPRG